MLRTSALVAVERREGKEELVSSPQSHTSTLGRGGFVGIIKFTCFERTCREYVHRRTCFFCVASIFLWTILTFPLSIFRLLKGIFQKCTTCTLNFYHWCSKREKKKRHGYFGSQSVRVCSFIFGDMWRSNSCCEIMIRMGVGGKRERDNGWNGQGWLNNLLSCRSKLSSW